MAKAFWAGVVGFFLSFVLSASTLAGQPALHPVEPPSVQKPVPAESPYKLRLNTDLRLPSGLTEWGAQQVLAGTELKGLSWHFVNAEKVYGVNARFLIALAVLESGGGTSKIFRQKNNLFGFRAYDGRAYTAAVHFSTPYSSIYHVADYLKEEYLSPQGKWFSGGFTLEHVSKRYSSDPDWAWKITCVAERLFGAGS